MGLILKPPVGRRINYSHPLAKGLVSCLVMNEGSGPTAYDLSGNGNDAAIVGAEWLRGNLYLDGTNDYLKITQSPSLNIDNFMTISFRCRFPSTPAAWDMLFDKGTGAYGLLPDNNTPAMIRLDIDAEENYPFEPHRLNIIADGNWHTMTLTAESGQLYGYIDQLARGSDTYLHNGFSVANDLHIGQRLNNSQRPEIEFEFFYIWNRVLLSSEIFSQLHVKPYAMFDPESIFLLAQSVAAGGGFQPAWARNSNIILQAGHL